MPRAKTTTAELPWWATPGSERCPVCLLTYHVETEYRCAACDGPLCPDCAATRVTTIEVGLLCADCAPADGDRREAR